MIEDKLKEGNYIEFKHSSPMVSRDYLYKIRKVCWYHCGNYGDIDYEVEVVECPTGEVIRLDLHNLEGELKQGTAKIYPDSIAYMKQRRRELNENKN